jgi:hypothetical protein
MIVRPALLDRDVLSFDEPGLLQALAQRIHQMRERRGRRAAEKPDHRHRLLRARRNRPRGCRAAE